MTGPPSLDRVVFAHDFPFLVAADGAVYSDRGDWTWHRYLAFADCVTVMSRMRPVGATPVESLTPAGSAGVRFAPLPSLSGPLMRYRNRPAARRILRAELEQADALIARLPSEIGAAAIRVADRLGKPWGVELVTCAWDSMWNYGSWQGRVYAPLAWATTRRLMGRSSFAVYETREFLQGRYPPGGRSIGCPIVELPEVSDGVLERRLEAIDSRREPLRIGLIGALGVGFKGIDTAIAALARERSRLPDFELRVLGSGDPRRWRELAERAGISAQVHFDGVLPSGDGVNGWLDEIDLYIQPSFQEGLPRGTLEAMSRGCPALGSTAGGIPELLEPDCLHRPGDERRLGELIARAAASRDWRRAQARRNFEHAKRYSKGELDAVRTAFWREFARDARAS